MDEKIKGYINKIVYCLLAVSICVNVVFISINSRTDKSYKDARATVDKLNGELTDISKTIGAAGADYTTLKEKLGMPSSGATGPQSPRRSETCSIIWCSMRG